MNLRDDSSPVRSDAGALIGWLIAGVIALCIALLVIHNLLVYFTGRGLL